MHRHLSSLCLCNPHYHILGKQFLFSYSTVSTTGDTRLLPNSSTCKFHPCCLYCQFPVLAISTLTAFTIIFQYLQIPTLLLYLQFPLLANSSPTKCITFNFHPVAFTVIFQYLQFPPPLLPNSITCKFSAPIKSITGM